MARLSATKQAKALAIIADWLGPQMGYDGPAPTGAAAFNFGEGPQLMPEWDWPSSGPTPTLILEGGPHDWAVEASFDIGVCDSMAKIGVFAEPYSGWALCLYSESA